MQRFAGNAALLSLGIPSGFEWIIILGFGLLIFGKRLPEVGKGLSKGIVEFKKRLKGVEDEQREPQERSVVLRRERDDEPSLSGPPMWLIVALAGAVVCAWWVMRSK
jgi:sec-independent protein translocase protein TatA